jgi:TolB protein
MKPAVKMRLAALLLVVVLIGSFFTVPGVTRAVHSLFGYIPGVGRVEQGAPLRALAASVSDSRDGYTLTVESAVLDATRTVITYRAAGEFPRWDDPALRPAMCPDLPLLRLPNGAALAYSSGEGGSNGVESTWKLVYGPLPVDVNRATLVLSCLPDLPAGEGPQDWAFALEFAPAPAALNVYPVVDLPTPTLPAGSAPVELPGSAAPAAAASAPHGITWTLDGMAVLADGYYLETTLAWPADPGAYEIQLYPDALHLTDAAGQEAAVWQADGGVPFTPAENLFSPLNLQTASLSSPGPARLTLDYVGVSRFVDASFNFDVGSGPRPGQVWPVNQDLELDGHHLRVLSAKYVETPPGAPVMMLVELESDSGIISVIANDLEHETLDSGGAPASDRGPVQAGWHYRGAFPQGTITVTVSMITARVDGPWTVEWTPPADTITPAPELPTAMPTLRPGMARCQPGPLLETAADELPAGLGGRVAYTQWNGERGELFVSKLDGSGRIALGPGAFPDLSPDGQQVVYRRADEATYVRDLASGVERLLPAAGQPGVYDNWPMWSPDGSQIAFYRVSGDHVIDLYVMDADGGSLRPVTSGPEDEILIGWSADGTGLYFQAIGAGGQSVRLLDLETGRSSEIARLPEGTFTASLSPDGSRLLYLTGQALWLDRLDGSPVEALLGTSGHFADQIHPLWSPDGRWVTVNEWETPGDGQPDLALLEVDGCRLVRLTGHPGSWLSDWVK